MQMVPWGRDGFSLDLMRRRPDSPNGTIEVMVADLVEWAKAHKVNRVSLNFAVFREAFERGDRLGAGPTERLEYRILMLVSRFAQLESLYRSNSKYEPDWQPRYVCYENSGDLLPVAIAMLRAEAFLTTPSFGRLARITGGRPRELDAAESDR